jgi:hypothetical protein
MLQTILFQTLPIGISLIILFSAITLVVFYQNHKNKKRWSPLTSKLLRGPGYSLVKEIDDINFDLHASIFSIWLFPLIIYSAHLSASYFGHQPETFFRIIFDAVVAVFAETYFIRQLIRQIDERSKLREGYEAESTVGSELNQLMLDGMHVFHDLQAEGFNIDHLIISSKGVFSVETKSRAKYASSGKGQNAKMTFDGESLIFPSHRETAPIEQARRNAKWVQEWVSKAVGEQIKVRPAVILPGWFVTLTSRSDVMVFNGKNCNQIFSKIPAHQALTSEQIQRVVHQIDQRCRDVEPTRYRRAEKSIRAKS